MWVLLENPTNRAQVGEHRALGEAGFQTCSYVRSFRPLLGPVAVDTVRLLPRSPYLSQLMRDNYPALSLVPYRLRCYLKAA